jgi:ATP-binding protein involved in chromosome partitioning
MGDVDKVTVENILAGITDKYLDSDLLAAGVVRAIGVDGRKVSVQLQYGYPVDRDSVAEQVKSDLESAPGIDAAVVSVDWKIVAHVVQNELKPVARIKNILAVASGKGGVGKSTVAANLALALERAGASVGVLDADIYGPSQPRMLGAAGQPEINQDNKLLPKTVHGLKMMSIGFLVEEDTPMIWRGPMVTSALQQLLNDTEWGELDYLVVDLPPGTGDIQLTLSQKIPVAGAIIVTTPQDIALLDARRGLGMFNRVNVSVLGVVENMSSHICSECGHEEAIFGQLGGKKLAEDFNIPLLGQLPLDIRIREQTDSGAPTVVAEPESDLAGRYMDMALRTAGELSKRPRNRASGLPQIVVQSGSADN